MRGRLRSDVVVAVLLLTIFAVVPTVYPFVTAITDADAWKSVIADWGRIGQLAITTAKLAGLVVLVSLPAATVLAVVVFRLPTSNARWGLLLLAVGLATPLTLYAGSWLSIVGPSGLARLPYSTEGRFGGMLSAAVISALAAVPWGCLVMGVGLRSVDRSLEEQALLCGSVNATLLRVTLPLCRPYIAAAALLCILPTLVEMTVSDLFVVRTFAEEVYTQYESGAESAAAVLISLPLCVGAALLLAVLMRRLHATRIDIRSWRLPSRARGWKCAALVIVGCYMLPLFALLCQLGWETVGRPPDQVEQWSLSVAANYLSREAVASMGRLVRGAGGDVVGFELGPLPASLGLALVAGAVASGASLVLADKWRSSHKALRWTGVVIVAWLFVIPGPVVGLGLIDLLNRPGLLGDFYDSPLVVVYAQIIRCLPYTLVVLAAAATSIDSRLVDAAALSGAGYWTVLFRVTWPMVKPAFLLAWWLGTVVAFNELAATKLVTPPGWDTYSLRLFHLLHGGSGNEQAALCLVLLATATVVGLSGFALVKARAQTN